MEKDRVDDSGDVYQSITISGGTVGAIGGRGHRVEQQVGRDATAAAGTPAAPGSRPVAAGSPGEMAAVRDLLLEAFTAADLRRLFEYGENPALRPAAQEFAEGDGLAALADKAIKFCRTRDLIPDLLDEVNRLRPRAYARYHEWLTGGKVE